MRLGIKFLSFTKPSIQDMDACAEEGCRLGPNHLVPGASLEFALEDENVTRLTRVSEGWIEDYDAVKRNPLQVVYVTEGCLAENSLSQTGNQGSISSRRQGRSFRFGQTTLEGHALAGEESFKVSWRPDNSVWYEIYAFSRAQTALAFAAFPLRRHYQKKFRRDSAKFVTAAVEDAFGEQDDQQSIPD